MNKKGFYACLLTVLFLLNFISFSIYAKEETTIRVGVFPYEGQLEKDVDGNYRGYGAEYLQEIAAYTGWRYEFIEGTWDECLSMLEQGELDLMGAVMRSPEREEIFEFSDEPMISGYGVLATTRDCEILPYEDFQAFEGLQVGALQNNMQKTNFINYSREHGFVAEIREYQNQEELDHALESGEVDAILMTNLLRSNTLRVIATFGENDGYFATTKGNAEVLATLNQAMRRIRLENPYYNSMLDQKYYDLQSSTVISFTKDELKFIEQSEPIPCVYIPDVMPITYYNDKTEQVQGIAVEICQILEERTGLTFTWMHPESSEEAVQMLSDGRALLLPAKYNDFSWAAKQKMALTDSYLQAQMVMVTREDAPDSERVAVYDQASQSFLAAQAVSGEAEIKKYATVLECMDAVLNMEADTTFINSTVASYLANNPKYAQLKTTPLYNISADVSMAVSSKADPLLLSVLNKGLHSISTTEVNQVLLAEMKTEQMGRLATFLYRHPVQIMLIICAVSLLLILLLGFLLYTKLKSAKIMRKTLYTDILTGYPNFRVMGTIVEKLFQEKKNQYALVYLDIHQFKAINDTFGYDAGDQVLIATSDILHEMLSKEETFARIYADTFAVLISYPSLASLKQRIGELSIRLEEIHVGESGTVSPLFCGGVYQLPEQWENLEQACDRANYAKSSISHLFSNTFVFYDDIMRNRVLAEKELEHSMVSVLEREEFVVYYQPKINAITGKVVGAEALVRWAHPEKGLLMPGKFLPFYEKNGFIVKIDLWVFEQVCRDMSRWMSESGEVVPISVNFSRHGIKDTELPAKLRGIADKYNISASLLEIEITETEELENAEHALEFVKALKSFGFRMTIDDYGTGYSSITFLQQQPLDALKLDRQFIMTAMCSDKARDVMRYLVTAMHRNGIQVICEGVETEEQRDFVVRLDCKLIQGFYYSKALPCTEFEAYVHQHGIDTTEHLNLLPITKFEKGSWNGAEDFIDHAMPSWIISVLNTEDYPIQYISPNFLEGMGYSTVEFEAATKGKYLEMIHPEDVDKVEAWMTHCSAYGCDHSLQYRVRKKDGDYRWVQDVSKRVLTDHGEEAWLCVCTDISDLVALQNEKTRLVDTIPGGMCELLMTENGPIIIQGTERFYEVIGHKKEQMEEMGNNLFHVLYAEDMNDAINQMQHIMSGDDTFCSCVFRVRCHDDSLHWISFRGKVFPNQNEFRVTVIVYRCDEEVEAKQLSDIARAKLELALTQTDHAVFEYDIVSKKVYSHSGLSRYGMTDDGEIHVERDIIRAGRMYPGDEMKLAQTQERLLKGERHVSYEIRINRNKTAKEADYRWIRVNLSTIFDQKKHPTRAVGIVEDISKQKYAEQALLQEAQFRKTFTDSSLMAFELNLTQRTIHRISGSRGFRLIEICKTLEKPDSYDEAIAIAGKYLIAKSDYERMMKEISIDFLLEQYAKDITEREVEYRRLTDTKEERWTAMLIHIGIDQLSGDVICYTYHRDIQERKVAEKGLEEKASHDSLTGIYNRASAEQMIETYLKTERMPGHVQAFLMMDLDRFKLLNDTYGHLQGDNCLIWLAQTIKEHLRTEDIVARIGGDEFAVLLKNLRNEEQAIKIAQKLSREIKKIGPQLGLKQEVGVSIGIALAPYHGEDFEHLYHHADKAMYQAKKMKSEHIALYREEKSI